MSATKPTTTLGHAPWPARPRKTPHRYSPINPADLSLCDDALPAARSTTGSKYATLFAEALKTGRAIKTPGGAASSISTIARSWMQRQGITTHAARSVGNYGDGHGRVWLLPINQTTDDHSATTAGKGGRGKKGGAA